MLKKILIAVILVFLHSEVTIAQTGILFLAHGSMKHHHKKSGCDNSNPTVWEKAVLDLIHSIETRLPYQSEVAFGMWNSLCFESGVQRLEKKLSNRNQNLDHLIVLPIFISSHSAVIEMQKFIFKKRPDQVIPIPSVTQTKFNGKITYLPAIDYDPLVSIILLGKFKRLMSKALKMGIKKEQMELVLVMHGPVSDQNNIKWLEMGDKYKKDITNLFSISRGHTVSLRDDAPTDVRDRATLEFRNIIISAEARGKKALILPLLLSKDGIEDGITHRLKGLDYIWTGEAILPSKKFETYLVERLIKL